MAGFDKGISKPKLTLTEEHLKYLQIHTADKNKRLTTTARITLSSKV